MTLFGDLPEQRQPIPPLSLRDFISGEDGVPRIADWRLAQVLGFQQEHQLRRLIERHRGRLERFGNLVHGELYSRGPGRPGSEYQLNFEQAIFIIVKSDALNADDVTIHVVQIYGMWARGEIVARDAAAEAKAERSLEKATQAAPEVMQTIFSMIQTALERIPELIANAVNGNMRMPKAEFGDPTKLAICREWLRQNPTGLDLLCLDRIIDEHGKPIRERCEIHHMKGLYRNGLEDGLPVTPEFHHKLHADRTETGPEWQQARNAHRVFLDRFRAKQPRDIFDA